MDFTAFEELILGGTGATLAVVLLAWQRCERNHAALREMVSDLTRKIIEKS